MVGRIHPCETQHRPYCCSTYGAPLGKAPSLTFCSSYALLMCLTLNRLRSRRGGEALEGLVDSMLLSDREYGVGEGSVWRERQKKLCDLCSIMGSPSNSGSGERIVVSSGLCRSNSSEAVRLVHAFLHTNAKPKLAAKLADHYPNLALSDDLERAGDLSNALVSTIKSALAVSNSDLSRALEGKKKKARKSESKEEKKAKKARVRSLC